MGQQTVAFAGRQLTLNRIGPPAMVGHREERKMETPKDLFPEAGQRKQSIALCTPFIDHRRSSADLPVEVHQAASRRWRLLPIPVLGRFATAAAEHEGAATCDLIVLEQWAIEFPDCNWALISGEASGVFVLEVDSLCGRTALHTLNEDERDCEETLQAKAGNMWHAFYRWPAGLTLVKKVVAPGLRIRENELVLIPPSRQRSGDLHAYVDPDAGIAPTPHWLLEAFSKPAGQSSGKVLRFPMPSSPRVASAVRSAELSSTEFPPFGSD